MTTGCTALGVPGFIAATHDGDSSPQERAWSRANANVLLTNPEMLHVSMLPNHARWAEFLHRLRFVVVDELHVLRGMFGSNVAHVLRRLRRLCAHYGSDPVFVLTSATIGGAAELASELTGLDVVTVSDDGSPRGERLFLVWDPSAEADPSEQRSSSRDASMWQQAGRAGRDASTSLAVLVTGDDQLDRWFLTHPDQLFARDVERCVINPANPHVLLPQLACAAYELPLASDDEQWWPDDAVRELVLDDHLRMRPTSASRPPAAVWAGRGRPADGVGLRSAGGDEFVIADVKGDIIGTVDGARALRVVHPGAVYLHQGSSWRVTDLDLDHRVATVEADDGDEYTQPRSRTDIEIISTEAHRSVGGADLHLGVVRVRTDITGYRRLHTRTREQLGVHDLDLPTLELVTRALWYVFDDDLIDEAGIEPADLPGALHAIEHAAIGILPLIAMCDRWDIGRRPRLCVC